VRRQLQAHPGILQGTETPEYGKCVDIVTKAALREMIVPALLPLAFVILVAVIPQLGPVVLGGVLVGTIVTGLFVAIADGFFTSKPAKFHLYNASDGEKRWESDTHSMNWPIVINSDGNAIVAGSDDGTVYYFNP